MNGGCQSVRGGDIADVVSCHLLDLGDEDLGNPFNINVRTQHAADGQVTLMVAVCARCWADVGAEISTRAFSGAQLGQWTRGLLVAS